MEPSQKRFFKNIGTISVGHTLKSRCEIQVFRIPLFSPFFAFFCHSFTHRSLSLGMLCWRQETQLPTEVLNLFLGLDLK